MLSCLKFDSGRLVQLIRDMFTHLQPIGDRSV